MPATNNRFLSFIESMNGEFEPIDAEFPNPAIKTIENFAIISLSNMILNSSIPLLSDNAMITPIAYNTIENIPADPTERSFIALRFFSFVPLVIKPSAKSARPSV